MQSVSVTSAGDEWNAVTPSPISVSRVSIHRYDTLTAALLTHADTLNRVSPHIKSRRPSPARRRSSPFPATLFQLHRSVKVTVHSLTFVDLRRHSEPLPCTSSHPAHRLRIVRASSFPPISGSLLSLSPQLRSVKAVADLQPTLRPLCTPGWTPASPARHHAHRRRDIPARRRAPRPDPPRLRSLLLVYGEFIPPSSPTSSPPPGSPSTPSSSTSALASATSFPRPVSRPAAPASASSSCPPRPRLPGSSSSSSTFAAGYGASPWATSSPIFKPPVPYTSSAICSVAKHFRSIIFYPEFDKNELPAHIFIRSGRNITLVVSLSTLWWAVGTSPFLLMFLRCLENVYSPVLNLIACGARHTIAHPTPNSEDHDEDLL